MWRLCPYLARIRKGHFYRRAERGTRQMTRLNPVGMESDNKVALCALAHRHNLAPCSECSRLGLIRHWTFKEQAIRFTVLRSRYKLPPLPTTSNQTVAYLSGSYSSVNNIIPLNRRNLIHTSPYHFPELLPKPDEE